MPHDVEHIWNEFHAKLHVFIIKRVHCPLLADDILQETFLKIQSHIETLRSKEKLTSWIYRIARNTMTDYFRTHKSGAALPVSLCAPETEPADIARREVVEGIMKAVGKLPEPYREPILLLMAEGLKHREVAARLQVSLPCVKARIQRGKDMMKDMVKKCCEVHLDCRGRVIDYDRYDDIKK
jgi:RNA polymerase sigma-70 factor, ECF subfamily